MTRLCLLLIPVAFVVSLVATWVARGVGRRLGALDGAGVSGQVKEAPRRVPNTGGAGIFCGIALPMAVGLMVLAGTNAGGVPGFLEELAPANFREFLPGLLGKAGDAWIMLASALVLHVLGLVDDRRPLGPWVKLGVFLIVATGAAIATRTRFFTMLDGAAGGAWASVGLTVLWFVAVTNALNFLDNMDGLAGGLGLVATLAFFSIALLAEQWFVAASLALLAGALMGFLFFNRPPASVFMGDGGSLVLGFLLAFLSVRITYARIVPGAGGGAWHGVLAPLVVLAVPMYDLVSVVLLRLSQGKSPMVGDLQHVSHRIARLGLSKPRTVLVLCGFAAATGLAGVVLTRVGTAEAWMLGVQVLLLLVVLAVFEFARST
jgi:UDP-GlcNAc:undecaprenyl-phosphate GlcNAc-1-phosphate transferase